MDKRRRFIVIWLLVLGMLLSGCGGESSAENEPAPDERVSAKERTVGEKSDESDIDETVQLTKQAGNIQAADSLTVSDIPAYSGSPYVPVNNNVPFFTDEELTGDSFETYSDLDELGRCGAAYANIGTDLMPAEKRGSIGKVKPSGWHSVEYDNVEGNSLYNRCHLIGYQLTAENANEKNLITGTRYLNTEGMLLFENMVADYVKETENHVLYRVTPIFEGDNLVASGVQMEGMSVEDKGEGILFHVYCYNVQPGISIDYVTGDSRTDDGNAGNVAGQQKTGQNSPDRLADDEYKADKKDADGEPQIGGQDVDEQQEELDETASTVYILNTNTHKFHKPSCSSVKQMKEANTEEYAGDRDELASMGYDPCKRCKP